jgi:DNA-binding beta-propeller fold protein YncE
MSVAFAVFTFILLLPTASRAQILLSGNENKIDLTHGGQVVVPDAPLDNLTLVDFSHFPPSTVTIEDVPNTVIGPPSNIAITPDGKLAIVANSIRIDPSDKSKYLPESFAHIVDLSAKPPKVVGRVKTDLQPSGLSITPDGKMALVANRASGTVSVLAIDGMNVKNAASVKVCEPAESISDIAISPDGKLALASVQKPGYLAVLKIDGPNVTFTGRKISAFGQPYRCVITPDGQLALTAGAGFGNGRDMDCVSVVDLTTPQPTTIDYIPVGVSPESIEISPDGTLLAAVVIEGSNTPPESPLHGNAGALVILKRNGKTFTKVQRLPVGRIPEGVAFTTDGKYLVVQCHPDKQLWVFAVKNGSVTDTGQRISVPGMPSSLRAGK